MNRLSRTGIVWTAAMTLTIVGMSGCQHGGTQFRDEPANTARVDTPSVRIARAAEVEGLTVNRTWEPVTVVVRDGAVLHAPLFFEDACADGGSNDGRFAVTGEDFLQMLLGPGRFHTNALLFPLRAIVTPPWAVMASDGRLGPRALRRELDAERRVVSDEPEASDGPEASGDPEPSGEPGSR